LYQNPFGNLQNAISAYEEALRFRTPERAPINYAATQNNLGNVYGDLAAYQNPVENLKHAITAYEEALRFRTTEGDPLGYAMTQNNMGTSYSALAAYQNPVENLQYAVKACEEALHVYSPEDTPLDYAVTQNNLGTTYRILASQQNPVENLQRAVIAYEEALRFRTPERAPLHYATTQRNIGLAFRGHALYCNGEKREDYLIMARNAFLQSEKLVPGSAAKNLVNIYAMLNNEIECLEWLKKCEELNRLPTRDHLDQDTDLDPIRNKPWFQKFIHEAYGDEK
jgi:tetratricopeptide (TPR) repeat protein